MTMVVAMALGCSRSLVFVLRLVSMLAESFELLHRL